MDRNKKWAERMLASDGTFFSRLADGQKPQILWIGCSDSRVPETTLLDLSPGQIFVHRNVANVVPVTDLSSMAVIEFAVDNLKVSFGIRFNFFLFLYEIESRYRMSLCVDTRIVVVSGQLWVVKVMGWYMCG